MVSDFLIFTKFPVHLANSGGPDQTLRSVTSDLGIHCLQITVQHLMRVYTVCQSRKNVFGQIHLKIKGCQVCVICCKFTKVPVLWQTVLTLI